VALQEASAILGLSDMTQFQSLDGGLTRAQIYSFEMEGKRFVLRFLALIPSHTKAMRQGEIQALKIGNRLGIAPRCVFSDQNAVLMVMPFIEGQSLRQPEDRQLLQLGEMLHALHSYSNAYPTRYTLNDRINLHYQKSIKSGIAYPTGFHQEVQKMLSRPCSRSLVPCHGDLNLSNILVDDLSGRLSIIDWTTATWEDPFADLSYFCLLSNLSPVQEEVFLGAYLGRAPSEQDYETLNEEKAKVCLLTATLWFRYSETSEEAALPLESRVSALDVELHSSTLKLAQDYLREGIVVDLNTASKSAIRSYALSFYKAYLNAQP
jgi:thiamine kinase-like enzyme